MEILDGYVRWLEEWDNGPELALLVDKIPNLKDLRYERRGALYYAELDGYSNFFYYSQPDKGYGGREFPIKLKDGTSEVLKGPWSSNCISMNRAGFGPCMQVSLTDDKRVMNLGHTFSSAAVTVKKILSYQDKIDIGKGWGIERPIRRGKPFEFPKGSRFHLFWKGNYFEPAVKLPDGKLWVKDKERLERDLGTMIDDVVFI